MSRRGFTVLELLVVIGLVLALASVVVPIVVTRAGASRLPEAQLQVEAALMMARADAQRDAAPVRVRARTGANGIVELVAESVDISSAADSTDSNAQTGGTAAGAKDGTGACEDRTRLSATYSLPRGVSVSESAGTGDSAPAMSSNATARTGAADSTAPGAVGEWVLLAVFLPNGEAIRPGPRYLVDAQGHAAELIVEPWSGRLSMRAVPGKATLESATTTAAAPEEPGR